MSGSGRCAGSAGSFFEEETPIRAPNARPPIADEPPSMPRSAPARSTHAPRADGDGAAQASPALDGASARDTGESGGPKSQSTGRTRAIAIEDVQYSRHRCARAIE